MAIEGVLTRQKCAETPYATFWHPPIFDLLPQKVITSLFKLSGFSPSRNTSQIRLHPLILSREPPAHIFRSFLKDARRKIIENRLFKSWFGAIWCQLVKNPMLCFGHKNP